MERKPVDSSHLRSIGWDEESEVLHAEFKDGSVYAYEGVSKEDYDSLMEARSHGKHFFANIKSVFSGKRIQ